MKNNPFFSVLIFAALSFTACAQGQNENEILSNEADVRPQIETTISPRFIELIAANGLVYKGCEYLGDVTEADYDDLITHWIDDDSYSVADFRVGDSTISFNVRKVKDIVKGNMTEDEWRERIISILERVFTEYPFPVTGKAELFWNYKGLDFSTICAVSLREDGRFQIVWDNITKQILIPGKTVRSETTEEAVLSEAPQTRASEALAKVVSFEEEFYEENETILAADVRYSVTATGYYYRNGTNKVITGDGCDYDSNAYLPWWSAACYAYKVHHEYGTGGIVIYDYAWAVSGSLYYPVDVDISYHGPDIGFSIYGGTEWDSGTIYIYPMDLVDADPNR